MNGTATRRCRCGLAFNARGLCDGHCDVPGPIPCRDECPRCAERDLHCGACHTRCGTRSHAAMHERTCRQREIDQARRRA